jgi:hypothetical protein
MDTSSERKMEPITITYIFFGTLWVIGAITYL